MSAVGQSNGMMSLAVPLIAFLGAYAAPVGSREYMPEHHTVLIVSGSDASLSALKLNFVDAGSEAFHVSLMGTVGHGFECAAP